MYFAMTKDAAIQSTAMKAIKLILNDVYEKQKLSPAIKWFQKQTELIISSNSMTEDDFCKKLKSTDYADFYTLLLEVTPYRIAKNDSIA